MTEPTTHPREACSKAFEWLQKFALMNGAPPEAGIALDEWHRLAMNEKQTNLWRHAKTGGVYRVLHVNAMLEWAPERGSHVVYTGFTGTWIRSAVEFFDGRFVRVQPEASTPMYGSIAERATQGKDAGLWAEAPAPEPVEPAGYTDPHYLRCKQIGGFHCQYESFGVFTQPLYASPPAAPQESWERVDDEALDAAEKLAHSKLPIDATFFPVDAHALANIALHAIREVRAVRTALADLRRAVWNTAIEAAALVVQPIPHVNEERTCGEVATQIRALAQAEPQQQGE